MEHQVGQPHAKGSVRRWIAITLKCTFAIALALLISIQKSALDEGGKQVVAAVASHETRPAEGIFSAVLGEHKSIAMEDGSKLLLNTSSRASVEMSGRFRAMAIHNGEALLNIAADPRKFVVHLATIDFETTAAARAHLRLDPDGTTRVDMLEGEGWIHPADAPTQTAAVLARFQPMHLKAGSSFSMQYDVRILEQFDPDEMARKLAWTHGQVILAGDTLRDAVAEFNRYNRRQLVIGDESIARLPTGGIFYATEIDTFTRSLNQLFRIRAVRMRAGDATATDVEMLVGENYSGI